MLNSTDVENIYEGYKNVFIKWGTKKNEIFSRKDKNRDYESNNESENWLIILEDLLFENDFGSLLVSELLIYIINIYKSYDYASIKELNKISDDLLSTSFKVNKDNAELIVERMKVLESLRSSIIFQKRAKKLEVEASKAPPVNHHSLIPTKVKFNPVRNTFSGTMPLMVGLASEAVRKLGWSLIQANKNFNFVTFKTDISWNSWNGISCTLKFKELTSNTFIVEGTAKQNPSGLLGVSLDLFREAENKVNKVIEIMKELSS